MSYYAMRGGVNIHQGAAGIGVVTRATPFPGCPPPYESVLDMQTGKHVCKKCPKGLVWDANKQSCTLLPHFPWGKFSANTAALQKSLNYFAQTLGWRASVPVDGKLSTQTCEFGWKVLDGIGKKTGDEPLLGPGTFPGFSMGANMTLGGLLAQLCKPADLAARAVLTKTTAHAATATPILPTRARTRGRLRGMGELTTAYRDGVFNIGRQGPVHAGTLTADYGDGIFSQALGQNGKPVIDMTQPSVMKEFKKILSETFESEEIAAWTADPTYDDKAEQMYVTFVESLGPQPAELVATVGKRKVPTAAGLYALAVAQEPSTCLDPSMQPDPNWPVLSTLCLAKGDVEVIPPKVKKSPFTSATVLGLGAGLGLLALVLVMRKK